MGRALAGLAILIGLCFLLTPFLLAVHRSLLLGEPATRYDFETSSPCFQMFFSWLALIVFLLALPSLLAALTAPRAPVYYSGQASFNSGFFTVAMIARSAALLFIQLVLVLFPAMAINAPGAAWQNAISDTRKHFLFVLAVTILPLIPIVLLFSVVTPMLLPWARSVIGLIAGALWSGAVLLVALTLIAVIASRLYQVVGDRLNTPSR
jgi:hypothetical protein